MGVQNIQAALITQYKKKKQLNQKVGKRPTDTSPKKTYRWLTHEKMLDIFHYQRNVNKNHNEISPHTGQNGYHQKSTKNKC